MENEILLLAQGIGAVVIAFIIEGLKKAGMKTKYAMLVSAGLGLAVGVLAFLAGEVSWFSGVLGGIMAGAVASGFYSGGKAIRKK